MTSSRLYSQVLGYYDFTGNPQVVNPMEVGCGVVDSNITHVHETTHRILASSTTTGHLVRLLVEGRKHFPQDMQADLNETVRHIIEACRMPHEAAATYFSLRSAAASHVDVTREHLAALPQYYRDAISYFEQAIGPILDGGTIADQRAIQAIVMTVTRLSLNVPIGGLDGFRRLADVRSLISSDNPTERFECLVDLMKAKHLTPILHEEISNTLTRYIGDDWRDDVARIPYSDIGSHFQEACEHMGQLFLELDVPFKIVLESQVLDEIEAFGSQPFSPYWEGTVFTKVRDDPNTSEVALHPGHPNRPKDYAIAKRYMPGSVEDIRNAVSDASREGFLFVHVRRPTHASPDVFELLAERLTDGIGNSRISCTLEMGHLWFFHDANPERVALKIDERLFRSPECRQFLMLLDNFSIPIFVLAHETTADRMAKWLETELKRLRDDYMVFAQHIVVSDSDTPEIESLCVAIAGNERDGLRYSTLLVPSEVEKLVDMFLACPTSGSVYAPTFSSKRSEDTRIHKRFERWALGEITQKFIVCTYLDDVE
ncbi:MAG: hypothetical protein ABII79_06560 [bacterium]